MGSCAGTSLSADIVFPGIEAATVDCRRSAIVLGSAAIVVVEDVAAMTSSL
jgi:hypothetical protein